MKLSQANELIEQNISDNAKKNIRKVAKFMERLTRKDNGYVQMRDGIVLALKILATAQESIDSLQTTKNGRDDLKGLLNTIFEQETATLVSRAEEGEKGK